MTVIPTQLEPTTRRASGGGASGTSALSGVVISGSDPFLVEIRASTPSDSQAIERLIKIVAGRRWSAPDACWAVPASERESLAAAVEAIETFGFYVERRLLQTPEPDTDPLPLEPSGVRVPLLEAKERPPVPGRVSAKDTPEMHARVSPPARRHPRAGPAAGLAQPSAAAAEAVAVAGARARSRGGVRVSGDGPFAVAVTAPPSTFREILSIVQSISGRHYDERGQTWRIPSGSRQQLLRALAEIESMGYWVDAERADHAEPSVTLAAATAATADLRSGDGRDWVFVPLERDLFDLRATVMAAAPWLRWSNRVAALYGLPPQTAAGWRVMRAAFARCGVEMTDRLLDAEVGEAPADGEHKLAATAVPLRPYQVDGSAFAMRYRRVLLADEPSLGKTFQALAAVAAAPACPCVVVCPPSLRTAWAAETSRLCPDADVRVLDAHTLDTSEGVPDFAVVSYSDLRAVRHLLPAQPRAVIFDDLSYIKNPGALRTAAAAELVAAAAVDALVIGLSGTPMRVKPKPKDLIPYLEMTGLMGRFGGADAYAAAFCAPRIVHSNGRKGPHPRRCHQPRPARRCPRRRDHAAAPQTGRGR